MYCCQPRLTRGVRQNWTGRASKIRRVTNTMKVELWVYDLSQGMASSLSLSLLGTHIQGVWHTSVVVYDLEICFGSGIQIFRPGQSYYGFPVQKISMGITEVPYDLFDEYLKELHQVWTADKYHLLENNCNHFSNDLMQFLVGKTIPDHITSLPNDFLSTPLGTALAPMINGFFSQPSQPSHLEQRSVVNTIENCIRFPKVYSDDYSFKDYFNSCLDIIQKHKLLNDCIKWEKVKAFIWTDDMDDTFSTWIARVEIKELEPFIYLKIQLDKRIVNSSNILLKRLLKEMNDLWSLKKSFIIWVRFCL